MYNPFSSGISAVKFSFSALVAGIFGYFTNFLGGFDTLLSTLLVLIAVDYISGVICAAYEKKLSSAIGFKGIIKKILMILIVGVSVTLQRILPQGIPLREITILFFFFNEGLSVLENTARVIPLPKKLKDVLLQLKEKTEKEDSGKKDKQ